MKHLYIFFLFTLFSSLSYGKSNISFDTFLIKVSGGSFSSSNGDYYIFKDENDNTLEIGNGNFLFEPGKKYRFADYGISSSHPFQINLNGEIVNNKAISGGSNGSDFIEVSFPNSIVTDASKTYYDCRAHSGMRGTLHIGEVIKPIKLISPMDGATGISNNPSLSWSDGTNIESFQVHLSNDQFQTLILDTSSVDTIITINQLNDLTKYSWKVRGYNGTKWGEWTSIFSFTTRASTFIRYDGIPDLQILSQNYPNPFNPTTKIQYNVPEPTWVILEVFNGLGLKIGELVNDQQNVGEYTVTFDASNFSSGIYFYRLTTSYITETKKMYLIK
tara:strand:- start:5041 stop:6033 length:993 start_codon:yes stop_codon:yes gene_type:complete